MGENLLISTSAARSSFQINYYKKWKGQVEKKGPSAVLRTLLDPKSILIERRR
jgi:hypothetical protein